MKEDQLARIREMAASAVKEEVTEWEKNYAILQGIAGALMGKSEKERSAGNVMARRLCSYYMRKAGYPYQTIANTVGVKNHATALYHYNTCEDFLQWGDKDYVWADKKAREMGVAR